jgi:hypothetical protein
MDPRGVAPSRGVIWAIRSAIVVALTLLVLAVVSVHLRTTGDRAIAECDQALAAGDTTTAIERARDAAMSLAPGSPDPDLGYDRLQTIAEQAEARGAFDQAAFAWRAMWTAIRTTRSEARESARLGRAGHGLVRIATRVCQEGQTRLPATCGATVEAALAQDDLPHLPRLTAVAFGALAFLGAGAVATETRDRKRRLSSFAVMAAGVVTLGFALLTR